MLAGERVASEQQLRAATEALRHGGRIEACALVVTARRHPTEVVVAGAKVAAGREGVLRRWLCNRKRPSARVVVTERRAPACQPRAGAVVDGSRGGA